MAEVGIIKREIAYHGDTINTASRIQEECKKQDKEFLISEELYQLLNKDNIFTYEYIDDVLLKGKSKNVKIYSVSRSDITST